MSLKKHVVVEKERTVNTYAEMWHCSRVLLLKAKADREGSTWTLMASLTFCAFAIEAFLNHLGDKKLACWKEIERSLSPPRKLALLCEHIDHRLDYGVRPAQTIRNLFSFRDQIAHGKDIKLKSASQVRATDDEIEALAKEFVEPEWQAFCTIENAERAREDAEALIRSLHEKAELEDPVFSHGMSFGSVTVVPDDAP